MVKKRTKTKKKAAINHNQESLYKLVKDIYKQIQNLRENNKQGNKHLKKVLVSSNASKKNKTNVNLHLALNHSLELDRKITKVDKTQENAILQEVKTIFGEMKELYHTALTQRKPTNGQATHANITNTTNKSTGTFSKKNKEKIKDHNVMNTTPKEIANREADKKMSRSNNGGQQKLPQEPCK